MIDLLFIAGDPEIARYAAQSGATRLFVDLEIVGKRERQGHLNTVISEHRIEDVARVKGAVADLGVPVMVRVNPFYEGLEGEIEAVIAAGADLVMPPMVASPEQLGWYAERVRGRAGVIPLVETPAGLARAAEMARVPGVTEVYVGLNDTHLAMELSFMFEVLSGGFVDAAAAALRAEGMRFGFGGIARMGVDALPGQRVLGEHVRLGSSSVILSRAFHGGSKTLAELKERVDLPREIGRLREEEERLRARSAEETEADRVETWEIIRRIARERRVEAIV